MNVLFCDKIHNEAFSVLKQHAIEYEYKPDIVPEELVSTIASYDGMIVRSRTKVTADVILAGKRLKVIGRAGSGVDTIDIDAARNRRIVIVNAPGTNAQAVAEHTIGLMFALLRHYQKAFASMQDGLWLKKELIGTELSGKTIGIIGYGNIGKIVEKTVSAIGAKTIHFSRHAKTGSYEEIFSRSDIVTLHVPLTDETRNSVSTQILSLMKPSSYLINTSRGSVIDEVALIDALTHRRIAGAALDVFAVEPLTRESGLRKLDNVILTPHIGASTGEAFKRVSTVITEEVVAVLQSKMPRFRIV